MLPPTGTGVTRVNTSRSVREPPARAALRLRVAVVAALAVAAATESWAQEAMAQSLLEKRGPGQLLSGRSVAYYGIQGDVEQRASIRAVLSSAQLDRVRYVPDVVAAGATFVLRLLLGGGGAPTDLAAGQADVESLLRE